MKHLICVVFLIGAIHLHGQQYQWSHSMGSADAQYEWANDTEIDADGNVYVTGFFFFVIRLDPDTLELTYSEGGADIFVQKFAPTGELLWGYAFGGPGTDKGTALSLDANGDVFLGGMLDNTVDFTTPGQQVSLTASGTMGCFVARFTADGELTNALLVPESDPTSDAGVTLRNTAVGDVIVAGQFHNTADFDPGPDVQTLTAHFPGSNDFYLLNLTNDLQFQWVVGTEQYDSGSALPKSVELDAAGYIYVGGYCGSGVDFDPSPDTVNFVYNGGVADSFIAKYAPDGDFLWANAFGSQGYDYLTCIAVDAVGNIYSTGYFQGQGDFDGGSGVTTLIADGNFVGFLLKHTAGGQLVWAREVGQFPQDIGTVVDSEGLALSSTNSILLGGRFFNTIDIDPGPDADSVSTENGAGFIIETDTSGNLLYTWLLDGPGLARVQDIAVNSLNEVAASGYIFGAGVDMDPGPGTDTLTSLGNYDPFVMKIGPLSTTVPVELSALNQTIYPNPGSTSFTIRNTEHRMSTVVLLDATGREVLRSKLTGDRTTIDCSALASGLFVYRLLDRSGAAMSSGKWIKE